MTTAWAILLASGAEEEFEQDSVAGFLNLNGRPILSYSMRACEDCADLDGYIVVAPRERLEQVQAQSRLFGCHKIRKIVPGGATYYTSLNNGLAYLADAVDTVVIHEVACPFVDAERISEVLKAARKSGVAVTGTPVSDPVGEIGKNRVFEAEVDASALVRLAPPYAFSLETLEKAGKAAKTRKAKIKGLIDLLSLVSTEIRVATAPVYPERLRSIADLPRLDALIKA